MRRAARGRPTWGLLSAGTTAILGMAFAVAAGNHSKGGLAVAGGVLMILAIAVAVVCAVAGLWRRERQRRVRPPIEP